LKLKKQRDEIESLKQNNIGKKKYIEEFIPEQEIIRENNKTILQTRLFRENGIYCKIVQRGGNKIRYI